MKEASLRISVYSCIANVVLGFSMWKLCALVVVTYWCCSSSSRYLLANLEDVSKDNFGVAPVQRSSSPCCWKTKCWNKPCTCTNKCKDIVRYPVATLRCDAACAEMTEKQYCKLHGVRWYSKECKRKKKYN